MNKIALIGGGGARTPAVTLALARNYRRVPLRELALYDINQPRQRKMASIATAILQEEGEPFALNVCADPEEAISGADFVIVSIRVGGQAGRAADERLALEHNCIGQETTGAAGFAYALRSIPAVQFYAEMTRRLVPQAWLINFTNPSGLVTQALFHCSPVPMVGVCDSPHVIGQQIAAAAGVPADEIDWTYAGLNHLGWVTTARHGRRDLLAEMLGDPVRLKQLVEDDLISADLVRHLGVVPNEYCAYYYYRDRILRRQLEAGETRGEYLARLDQALESELAEIAPDDIAALIEAYGRYLQAREESYLATERQALRRLPQRSLRELILSGGEGYIGVALRIISGLRGAGTQRAVLNVANDGIAVPGMDDDDIVETMCEVTPDGIWPLPGPPLVPESLELLRTVKVYERLTASAALTGSRRDAIRALTHHPLVGSVLLAEELVNAYLDRHREHLTRFAREAA